MGLVDFLIFTFLIKSIYKLFIMRITKKMAKTQDVVLRNIEIIDEGIKNISDELKTDTAK